ncbi:response regulator [Geomonas anaerohicana]|uniref:Response regulator n=1 Tax=Geomonas anaerohicana TaxID=2798583 RepID=A0ABS0YG28_9BACT|nr:response regulator [Geomonas anaerohicana]MBJ6751236.1 response regulator [Geomonas anaerohicana]
MSGAEKVETILLADDEQLVRDTLHTILTSQGYKVITAADGQEALETFTENPTVFDLFLTDIVMPGMSGVETYKEMKKITPIKVIFMTGMVENLPPYVHILLKPFPPVQLLHMIRTVLDNKLLDL